MNSSANMKRQVLDQSCATALGEMHCARFAQVCSVVVMAVGTWGLFAWLVGRPDLTALAAHPWPVSPRSALALVLIGSALGVCARSPHAKAGRIYVTAAAGMTFLLGAWSLLETFTAFRLGIEARVFQVPPGLSSTTAFPMSCVTAFCLGLAGAALLGLTRKPGGWLSGSAGVCGLLIFAVNGVVLLGHLYGAPLLYEGNTKPVNLFTALAVVWAGLGLVSAAGPQRLPLRMLAGPSVRARLLRVFVPTTFVLMLLAELLPDFLLPTPAIHPALHNALHALLASTIVVTAVLLVARSTGQALDQAQAETRAAQQELERRVEERTAELSQANRELRAQVARRQQMEDELRESLATFSALGETVPILVMIHRQGQCLYANQAAEAILGRTREELRHCLAWELVHPDYRDLARERILGREGGELGLPPRREYPFPTPDGRTVWLDIAAARIEFEGEPAVLACGLDVTERRQMEESLRSNEERFREVVENIREVFWMTDPAKRQMLYVSRAYEAIWGRSCESLYAVALGWLEAVLPEDRDRVRTAAFTLQAQGKYHEVYRIRRPDGSLRWIEDRAFPVLDERGEVYRIAGIAEDITERKHAEEVLQASEERFRTLFESAPIAIALHGADGRYIQVNRAYCEMLGYPAAELLRLGARRVTHPEDVPAGRRLYEQLLAGKRDHYGHEKRYLSRAGQIVWAFSAASAVRHSDGRLRYIVSMVLDITERKRLQSEILEISARERRRLGHNLHDGLGQHLSGTAFKAKCLEEALGEAAPAHAAAAGELVQLINRAISQTRALARGLDPIEVEVGGLVSALQGLASESEKLFGIQCRFACDRPEVSLEAAQALHLFHIAQEAINNAARHGEARRIDVELAADNGQLRLAIRDNGKGFAAGGPAEAGLGMRIMRYRADSIGASLRVRARPGRGVEVECVLAAPSPVEPAGEEP